MVKVEDRKMEEQKLAVIVEAIRLANHTLQISSNKKVFTAEYDWLTNTIRTEALNIHRCLNAANNTDLYNCYAERRELQRQAYRYCNDLKADIIVAKSMFHLRTKRVVYWTRMVDKVLELIKKWSYSDADRYKNRNKK